MKHAIEIDNLTKAYPGHLGRKSAPSVDGLSLNIGENEVFGFIGRNGAGKTTTIKVLCGLIRPTSGTARVSGIDVSKRASRNRIGYLPENAYFYEYLTPRETFNFYGMLADRSRAEREREWDELSELLDLRDIANQRIREFSKGMRQRLGFGIALIGNPDILILDEPMSGLDPLGRRSIRELILYLHEQKKTVFFSSHVLADVQQICTQIAIINSGKLVVEGPMDTLLRRELREVEVIASGVSAETRESLAETAHRTRDSEDGHHFIFGDLDTANQAVQQILSKGGRIVEFVPQRESLEQYFVRLESSKDTES